MSVYTIVLLQHIAAGTHRLFSQSVLRRCEVAGYPMRPGFGGGGLQGLWDTWTHPYCIPFHSPLRLHYLLTIAFCIERQRLVITTEMCICCLRSSLFHKNHVSVFSLLCQRPSIVNARPLDGTSSAVARIHVYGDVNCCSLHLNSHFQTWLRFSSRGRWYFENYPDSIL